MITRAVLLLLLLGQPAPVMAAPSDEARARFLPMIAAEAERQKIPAALADAVTTVESAYAFDAVGADGEIGLMQVLPSTAAMLGFHGTNRELADPATNIRLGITYLAGAWTATGGRLCDTLMKYRAGYGETVMSLRSILYCRRARDYLAGLGSPLAEGPGTELPPITPEMLAADPGPARGRMPQLMTRAEIVRMRAGHRTAADSQRFWAAEEAYIRTVRARFLARHQLATR